MYFTVEIKMSLVFRLFSFTILSAAYYYYLAILNFTLFRVEFVSRSFLYSCSHTSVITYRVESFIYQKFPIKVYYVEVNFNINEHIKFYFSLQVEKNCSL